MKWLVCSRVERTVGPGTKDNHFCVVCFDSAVLEFTPPHPSSCCRHSERHPVSHPVFSSCWRREEAKQTNKQTTNRVPSLITKGWVWPVWVCVFGCVSMCTCLKCQWKCLLMQCPEGGSLRGLSWAPPTSSWGPWPRGSTHFLTDLWPMINVQERLSYTGQSSKIRPIFLLHEWCSVIFLVI